jgi:polyisoprenoid-binding protein YceI
LLRTADCDRKVPVQRGLKRLRTFQDQTMTARLAVAAASAALFAGSAALAQGPANPDPAAVRPGTYRIEPSHTRVLFSVSHMGFTTWYGDLTGASGELTLDPAHPQASRLEVTLPVASVSTTNAKLDDELKSADWLDTGRFPTATFHSTRVTPTGPRAADIAGELTLHGVTRPVVLHARFNGAGVNPLDHQYTTGFEVNGVIRRSQFGVTKYVPLVGDDVNLIISAGFEQAPR